MRPSPPDEQVFLSLELDDNSSPSETSSEKNYDHQSVSVCSPIDSNPVFPLRDDHILSPQAESDLTDSGDDESTESLDDGDAVSSDYAFGLAGSDNTNALTSTWTLPTPNSERANINDGVNLNPVEEGLLCLLMENNLPKRMYPEIMEWAHHAFLQDYSFNDSASYQTVLRRMMKKYGYVSGGPPINEIVRVLGCSPVHVYRFDFLLQATRLFSDPVLMNDSLWGYNPLVHPVTGERVYREMNTGDMWKLGDEYVQSRVSSLDPSDGLPHKYCPVILFIDSTLVDRIGRLKVEPVLCSFGNICGSKRSAASSWFILGFIPPNTKSSQEVQADRKSVKSKYSHSRYYHACVKSILQDLLAADQNGQGHKMWVPSQGYMWLHFKLSLIIGDTEGHDKLCGHYCSYSSNIQRMCRDCDIPQSFGDDPHKACEFVKVDEIKQEVRECIPLLDLRARGSVKEAQNRLSAISQLPVWSPFFDFDFCGCVHGIFGSCPFERLHAWQTGIMKDGMQKLFLLGDLPTNFVRWYNSNDASTPSARPQCEKLTESKLYIDKAKFEAIFRYLTMYARRQSDREVPRTPFRNGVTDLTRLNGQEYPGLVMLTVVALKVLLHNKLPLVKQHEIIQVFWRMLVLNDMMNLVENPESTVVLMEARIIEFLDLYRLVFGPISALASKTGLCKVKFHAPKHAPSYIRRYGASENFFGGNLESALKSTVKAPTKITSRRHEHLAKELASRQHERFVCRQSRIHNASLTEDCREKTSSDSKRQRRLRPVNDTASVATDKPIDWQLHTPVFSLSRQGEENWSTHIRSYTHTHTVVYPDFTSKEDTEVFHGAEQAYVTKVAEYAKDNGFQRIDCSCGASIPSSRGQQKDVLHCHPSFHSYPHLKRPWFDWGMVKWLVTDDNEEEGDDDDQQYVQVAARLLLFARLSENEDDSKPSLIVAVIHSLQHYEPAPDSLLYFAKGDTLDDNGLVVIEATSIAETAFVLPCVKNQGEEFPLSYEAATYFLVFPPRHKWIDIW